MDRACIDGRMPSETGGVPVRVSDYLLTLLDDPRVSLDVQAPRTSDDSLARFIAAWTEVWASLPAQAQSLVHSRLPPTVQLRGTSMEFWRLDPVARKPRVDFAFVDFRGSTLQEGHAGVWSADVELVFNADVISLLPDGVLATLIGYELAKLATRTLTDEAVAETARSWGYDRQTLTAWATETDEGLSLLEVLAAPVKGWGMAVRRGYGLVVGHTDIAHGDSHADVAHSDTAHVDTHTDAHSDSAHGDSAHTDTSHSDTSHSDSHGDTSHLDDVHQDTSHSDSHSDVGHSDTAHSDSHSDVAFQDNAHLDHDDLGSAEQHHDVEHGDVSHSDQHTDSHGDVAHSDGHGDTAHTDEAHEDQAHSDSHGDTAHNDTAHGDTGHTDQGHVDSHSDVAHVDTAHSDSAHSDVHHDSAHGDAT